MTFERIMKIEPAHDCIRIQPCKFGSDRCVPDGGGSHGIGCAMLYMTVRAERAEVALEVFTGWYLPETPKRVDSTMHSGAVTIHTAFPRYDQDTPYSQEDCELWTPCYLDSGYLIAKEPTALLVSEGTDATWKWLEEFLTETLNKEE